MARSARGLGESGIYHVMLRGIDRTQLFYDTEDRLAFLERLARIKDKDSFELYAYALVGNHIHLLIKEGTDTLSLIVKRLTVSYSYWFNAKYTRGGYLFQGRFRSEPVDDEGYLLTVFKYIHQNPVMIGESIDSWTSYNDYMGTSELIDADFMLGMFGESKVKARKELAKFLEAPLPDDSAVLGAAKPQELADEEAIARIKRIGNLERCNELAEFDKASRDQILARLKRAGFSIRQISRLTGINRGIVQRAKEVETGQGEQ